MSARTALQVIQHEFSKFSKLPENLVNSDTRIDDNVHDDLAVIEFLMRIEEACNCDLPDYERIGIMTLGQLALLVEKHSMGKA